MTKPTIINKALTKIRKALNARGFEVYLVGGCVRDLMVGATPKDIDLTTSANPQEQIECYIAAGFRYIETGVQHGTISVVMNGEVYEITSMRTEANHDGRYAEMAYTRDLEEDLSRRDLTINAMAMTFDGVLIDPFKGAADLKAKRVRFVGNAEDRMREDYLRILRLLRFQGRFSGGVGIDPETAAAVRSNASGLRNISRERVWAEMAKIISGTHGPMLIDECHRLGIAEFIDLPMGDRRALDKARGFTRDPVSLLVAYVGSEDGIDRLARKWKWSARERYQGMAIARPRSIEERSLVALKREAVLDNVPLPWLAQVAAINGDASTAASLENWTIPDFPVSGNDLIATGMKPGRDMGVKLTKLRIDWADGGYVATKEEILGAA